MRNNWEMEMLRLLFVHQLEWLILLLRQEGVVQVCSCPTFSPKTARFIRTLSGHYFIRNYFHEKKCHSVRSQWTTQLCILDFAIQFWDASMFLMFLKTQTSIKVYNSIKILLTRKIFLSTFFVLAYSLGRKSRILK